MAGIGVGGREGEEREKREGRERVGSSHEHVERMRFL